MIVSVGSVALDTTRTPFRTVERVLGGSATFFSSAASLFHPVGTVSVVGEDFPNSYLEALERRGVDIRGIERRPGKTFFFDSKFDADFHHRTALHTELGVVQGADPKVPVEYRGAQTVFFGPQDPERAKRVLAEFDSPKLRFADTIEYYVGGHRAALLKLFSEMDGVIINDVEARELGGTANLVKAAFKIQAQGPRVVIVKKGEHGSLGFFGDEIYPFPGFPLANVADPTGAGDSFAGGFVGHLARQSKLDSSTFRQASVYANVMGSFAVEEFSVNRLLNLTREEVEERYAKFRDLLSF